MYVNVVLSDLKLWKFRIFQTDLEYRLVFGEDTGANVQRSRAGESSKPSGNDTISDVYSK